MAYEDTFKPRNARLTVAIRIPLLGKYLVLDIRNQALQ